MSSLLGFASCSALSPAGAAHRGGPAARSSPGAPSLALALSGGVHLAALALCLAAAARSGFVEPRGMEIRARIDQGFVLTPPPLAVPADAGGRAIDPEGRIEPVQSEEPSLAENLESLFRVVGPANGVRPDVSVAAGGGGDGGPVPPGEPPAAGPDIPTDYYDEPPVPIVAPEPPYSEMARDAGIEGRVVLEALVSWEGHVRDVRIREGNPILAAPAVKTVKTWRFRPARWQGRPVTTWVSIPIVFRLQ